MMSIDWTEKVMTLKIEVRATILKNVRCPPSFKYKKNENATAFAHVPNSKVPSIFNIFGMLKKIEIQFSLEKLNMLSEESNHAWYLLSGAIALKFCLQVDEKLWRWKSSYHFEFGQVLDNVIHVKAAEYLTPVVRILVYSPRILG